MGSPAEYGLRTYSPLLPLEGSAFLASRVSCCEGHEKSLRVTQCADLDGPEFPGCRVAAKRSHVAVLQMGAGSERQKVKGG